MDCQDKSKEKFCHLTPLKISNLPVVLQDVDTETSLWIVQCLSVQTFFFFFKYEQCD